VTTADEMAELADPFSVTVARSFDNPLDERVFGELSVAVGRSRFDLLARTGADLPTLTAALGRLELAGAAAEGPNGWRAVQ
jgi:DNA processing protein